MLDSKQIGRYLRASWAIALASVVAMATGASADIIKKEDMQRGIAMTRAQCEAIHDTVWVNVYGRDFCVRYYLSTAGGEGRRPVVFLQGDYFGKLDPKTWTWIDTADTTDIDTDDLMSMADSFSKMAKTTAIYLARIGVEGTSGNHTSRKTLLELNLMNAALDAIKQRHGFEGFHLVGQSGGSKLVGGLIGLRHDIACAVAGSGPMVVPGNSKGDPGHGDPGRTFFDVTQRIAQIAQNRALRILLATDPADKQVPIAQQRAFVDKLRQLGRSVPEFMVQATDEHHHGVLVYSRLIVAGCVLGKTDAEIAKAVTTLVSRNAEFNARRQKEIANRSGIAAAAARQPASDARAAPGGS